MSDSEDSLSSLEPLSESSADSEDEGVGGGVGFAGASMPVVSKPADILRPGFKIHCDSCGALHRNARLCDTYRTCHFCFKIFRQPSQLQVTHSVKASGPLHICAAAYGHPTDARQAVDCAGLLQKFVNTKGRGSELRLPPDESVAELLGDPCPGTPKQLRLRYEINGRRAERLAVESEPGFLAQELLVRAVAGQRPKLVVRKATYGHPRGVIRGRGAFDVTEYLQARVDDGGGNYLEIRSDEALADVLGDPCAGVSKTLVVEYEVLGRHGQVKQLEARGKLQYAVELQSTPCVAPLLLIEGATYGLSEGDVALRVKDAHRELVRREMLARRMEKDLPVTADEARRVRERGALRAELGELERLAEDGGAACLTVTREVQQLVDAPNTKLGLDGGAAAGAGPGVEAPAVDPAVPDGCNGGDGICLALPLECDLNTWLGDPCPGFGRVLRIRYSISALDDCGDSSEMTRSGHRKNFLIPKRGTMELLASANGTLLAPLRYEAAKCLPVLQVHRASFGHPHDMTKVFDITSKVQDIVQHQGGYQLKISKEEDITAHFKDPCRGVRKVFQVGYECLGLAGLIRVREVDGFLQASLRIGYPGEDKGTAVSEVASRLMTPAHRQTTPG